MNTTKNSSFYTNVSNCIICLEEVRCRGKLSVCKHWFCFGCILEWSKNTNTCPVCKTRFRSISKVHLSPLKSPPTKVRVPDKDQRVWNDDDDDVITEEILYDIQNELREDMDDDYEPPTHRSSYDPYHDDLDEYDLEDSFIDDSSLTQPASRTPERFLLAQELIDHAVITRNSPYMLRRLYGRRGTGTGGSDVMQEIYAINDMDEDTMFEDFNSDESCASSSTDSSGSSTDQEDDESNKRTMRTRSSRNTRSLGRNTASRATRNTGSQAPMRNRRSQAPRTTRSQASTSNTRSQAPKRSTRSQARHQNEQTRNQRRREDQLIAQSIQETGSSGWLNTRSTNERAAAAPVVAQTTIHNSSPCRTRRNTMESSHGHAHREHNLRSNDVDVDDDDDIDDDVYESDKGEKSPVHPSGSRVKEEAHQKKARFSRIRVPSPSDSELSEIVDLSPTKPNAQQTERKSTENDNRNSTINRNMEVSLPSSSREIDDDPTYNQSEEKKWKRIRNGYKGKGKKPLSRSLFPQRPSAGSVDDPDYIPNLSDQLPSKRSRLDSVRNRNVGERQESSSATTRRTRSAVRRLENNSYPECSASPSMWSLATSNVNHQYDLRKHIQGSQNTSDDDDNMDDAASSVNHQYDLKHIQGNKSTSSDDDAWDDYVRKTNVQHIRKRRNVSTAIRMPHDYKDDDSDDEQSEDKRKRKNTRTNRAHHYDDADDDRKSRGKEQRHITVNRSNDDDADDDRKSRGKEQSHITVNRSNDDDKHVGKRKRKETTVSRLHSCRDDIEDDDDMDDAAPNFIKPTPQPDKKRSLFTRRQHRTINEQFEDPLYERDHPRTGIFLQAQAQLSRSSSKTKPCNHENDQNSTNVTSSKESGVQLVKKVSNNDFVPEPASVGSNHVNGSCSSNKPTVTRTRRRIKVYDSDSD